MALLTFHPDRLGDLRPPVAVLPPHPSDTHWLLASAIEHDVVTIDPAYAADQPTFGVRFETLHRHEGELWIVYASVPPMVTTDVQTDYPDDFDELDEHAQKTFPSTLPAPTDHAACLEWLVTEFNTLHSRTLDLAAKLIAKAG